MSSIKTNETWEDFAYSCYWKDHDNPPSGPECSHISNRVQGKCLEKKYCPRVMIISKATKPKPEWHSYDKYLEEHDRYYSTVIQSADFVAELEKTHEGFDIDIRANLDQAKDYWRSHAGHERKIKQGGDSVDWPKTYRANIEMRINRGSYIRKPRARAAF